jgi:hypothetical protein
MRVQALDFDQYLSVFEMDWIGEKIIPEYHIDGMERFVISVRGLGLLK